MCSCKPYFLGIDPSITNTGVVLLDPDGNLSDYMDAKQCHKGSTGFARYEKQASGITKWVKEHTGKNPVVCGYENYSLRSIHRAYDIAEYGGILKLALRKCLGVKQPIYLVPPTMCKSFATGYGYATKDQMRDKAAEEAPELKGKSADICDAYFLAKFAAFASKVYDAADKSLLRHRIEKTAGYAVTV